MRPSFSCRWRILIYVSDRLVTTCRGAGGSPAHARALSLLREAGEPPASRQVLRICIFQLFSYQRQCDQSKDFELAINAIELRVSRGESLGSWIRLCWLLSLAIPGRS